MNRYLTLLLLMPLMVCGQQGTIGGRITDLAGQPLPGVNIQIQQTFIGTSSDTAGRFQILDVPPGEYNLSFSMIGYTRHYERDLAVVAGIPIELEVKLSESVLSSPQVVVTSSRHQQDIMESPFTVVAVGPRELADKGVTEMLEALTYEAGVSSVKGQLNIRGASGYAIGAGSRSLLLIDGIPQMGAAAGNIGWDNVPTSEIDRVEIVKSGGSALYGSSAMGGVVNVITRNAPRKPETKVRTRIGCYSQPRFQEWQWRDTPGLIRELEVSHSRPLGVHAGWFRLQRRVDDGFLRLNWSDVTNLTSKLKFNFSTAHSAALFLNVISDDGGLLSEWRSPNDPFEAPAGSKGDHTVGLRTTLNAHYNRIYSDDMVLKTRASGFWNNWDSYGADPEYSNESRYFADAQINLNTGTRLNTTGGITAIYNGIDAQMFGNHHSQSLAAYLLGQQKLRDLTTSLGIRWEGFQIDERNVDHLFTPQLALNWNPQPWLAARVSTGKGFRTPTVAEMFTSTRRSIFRVEPNPELGSETSVSRELGVTLMGSRGGMISAFTLDAALFSNLFNNLIEPTPDSLGVIHFVNIADARITGADINAGLSLWQRTVQLKTAYTWLDPVELDGSGAVVDTLSYRYRHHWVTSLSGQYQAWTLSMEYRYASRMDAVELYPENALTGQDLRVPVHVWNLGLAYDAGRFDVLLRVNNLFQYYYTQLERNMAEERLAFLVVNLEL